MQNHQENKDRKENPISWEAKEWYNLVDEVYLCTEPPLSNDIPTEDLMLCHASKSLLKLPDFPSYSQSVETSMKLVTEASHSYYRFDNRHKSIMAKITGQKMRFMFASKSSYSQTYDLIL